MAREDYSRACCCKNTKEYVTSKIKTIYRCILSNKVGLYFLDIFSPRDVTDLLKESEKMMMFDHPNVLSLIGVCVDAGKAPYLVMPYMANGSLMSYLRNERPNLTITNEAGDELVQTLL